MFLTIFLESHYNLQVFRFETCRSRSPSLKVAQVVNMTFVNFPPSQRSGCHHVARLGSEVANVSPNNPSFLPNIPSVLLVSRPSERRFVSITFPTYARSLSVSHRSLSFSFVAPNPFSFLVSDTPSTPSLE